MKQFYAALCCLLLSVAASAQNAIIKGKITTTDGHPAAFVNVMLKETGKGAIAQEDGHYVMNNVKQGSYTLVVSHAGQLIQQQPVSVTAGATLQTDITLRESARQLAEIIVEGRKTLNGRPIAIGKIALDPMDLPQSITIIDEGVMRDQQVQRLSDVIRNVNGMYLGTTRGAVQESFYARGYNLSTGNMFKNGFRMNTTVMPEMSSLEKVEVLKGNAAILYGNVQPGGIINMVTKKPRFETGGEISMRAGSYDLFKPAVDIYGPLSSHVAYRVNGTYEKANSYRDVVRSEKYYVNPSLLFKVDKRTELLVQGDYLHHDFTPDFGIGSLDNTKISPIPRSAFLGAPWAYNRIRQATASAELKHRYNERWELNVAGSYQSYRRNYFSTERIQAAANGDWGRPVNKIRSSEDYAVAQANLTGRFSTGRLEHALLAGMDVDYYKTVSRAYKLPKVYDSINVIDPTKFTPRTDIPEALDTAFTQTPVIRFGAYVQDLVSVSEKIKVMVGLRWSFQESRPARTTYLLKNDSVATGAVKTDKAFSPRVGLVYRPLPTTSVFASYSNSFSVNTGTDVYNNALSPSIIDQYEIGVKNDLLDGRLSVNLTFYRIVNNNLAQTAQFAADGVTPNNNTSLKELTGQTTSDGIELDIMSHPLPGLSILAGYSYNNMRYTKTPDTKGSYVTGERLVNSPAHTANGSVFYTFESSCLKGLKLGASAYYTGNRFGGWNNTKGQSQAYSRLIPVSDFTTVDVSAGYAFRKISLLLKVSNLANTLNYYVHENYSINPIPPRQVIGTVAYRF